MSINDLGSHQWHVGQGERGRLLTAGQGELDSKVILLWEINHSSQALDDHRGPDAQCILALLSGSWAVCRVGRNQLNAGLPSKQLCHKRGWGGVAREAVVGDHKFPSHWNHLHLTNDNHLFCKCVKWVHSGDNLLKLIVLNFLTVDYPVCFFLLSP